MDEILLSLLLFLLFVLLDVPSLFICDEDDVVSGMTDDERGTLDDDVDVEVVEVVVVDGKFVTSSLGNRLFDAAD